MYLFEWFILLASDFDNSFGHMKVGSCSFVVAPESLFCNNIKGLVN